MCALPACHGGPNQDNHDRRFRLLVTAQSRVTAIQLLGASDHSAKC
jgi:hypothetical protein